MLERRALKRFEINQLALVHVDGVRGAHPCLVIDIHRDGAKLHSSTHHTVAYIFALSLDGFKTTRYCRVLWRDKNTCGVKFIDRAGAVRAANQMTAP
jgi:hypothetical protein